MFQKEAETNSGNNKMEQFSGQSKHPQKGEWLLKTFKCVCFKKLQIPSIISIKEIQFALQEYSLHLPNQLRWDEKDKIMENVIRATEVMKKEGKIFIKINR